MRFLSIAMPHFFRCTPGSMLMAVLSSNLLLAVISIFLRSVHTVKDSKYKIIYIFPIIVALRCLFPIELPFSKKIHLSDHFIRSFSRTLCEYWGRPISLITLLLLFWWVVSAVKGLRYFYHYFTGRWYASKYAPEVTRTEMYANLTGQICSEFERENNFRIFRINGLNVPALQGLRKPFIFIPGELKLCEEDMYYVLKYHMVHHFRYSQHIKFLLNLFEILFWWNPAIYLLKRQVGFFLDIQADERVTKGEKPVVCEYISVRMRVLRSAVAKGENVGNTMDTHIAELNDRFLLMLREQKEQKLLKKHLALAAIMLAILFSSYHFVPSAGTEALNSVSYLEKDE